MYDIREARPPVRPVEDGPLVSVIMPVFNGGKWLAEAIDSVLAQTWQHIEVIVVDDGSTDEGATRAVAESYGDQIRYIHKPNGGVASALNAGIRAMSGAYFSWLSHDDLYRPEKIAAQVEALQRLPQPAIAFSDFVLIDRYRQPLFPVDATGAAVKDAHPIWNVLEGRLNGCALLIPRICFEVVGTFDEDLPTTQDYHLWFRMSRHFRFVPVPGLFVQSRQHPDQGSRDSRHLDEASVLWMDMLAEITGDQRQRIEPSETRLLSRLRHTAPHMAPMPGAAAWMESWAGEMRAQQVVTVVVPSPYLEEGLLVQARLAARGYSATRLVFTVQRSSVSPVAFCRDITKMHRIGSVLPLPDGLLWTEILERICNVSEETDTVLLWDRSASSIWSDTDTCLESVLAGEVDAILEDDRSSEIFGPFSGAISRIGLIQAALKRGVIGEGWGQLRQIALCGNISVVPRMDAVTEAGIPSLPPPTAESLSNFVGLDEPIPCSEGMSLALVLDGSREADLYAMLLAEQLCRSVRILTICGLDSEHPSVVVHGVGTNTSPLRRLNIGPAGLGPMLREWGVARVDLIGLSWSSRVLDPFLDALSLPFDITLLNTENVLRSSRHGSRLAEPLQRAERILVPTQELSEILRAEYPILHFETVSLPGLSSPRHIAARSVRNDIEEHYRVLVFASILGAEQLCLVDDVCRLIDERNLPFRVEALGQMPRLWPSCLRRRSLHLAELPSKGSLMEYVGATRAHVLWLPSADPVSVALLAREAMRTALPILTTGSSSAAGDLTRHPHAVSLVKPTTDDVIEAIMTLSRPPRIDRADRALRLPAKTLDPSQYLHWLDSHGAA